LEATLAWVRLDDHFDQHPKLQAVGPIGLAMFVSGLAYCNRNLTDGFIPWSAARGLLTFDFLGPAFEKSDFPAPEGEDDEREMIWTVALTSGAHGHDLKADHVIELLLRAGLWKDAEGGYKIHDYLDYQPSKKEVISSRESNRKRQETHRDRHRNEMVTPLLTPLSRKRNRPPVPDPLVSPVPKDSITPPRSPKGEPCEGCVSILKALNDATGRHYSGNGKGRGFIHARHTEAGIPACLTVIERKAAAWLHGKMAKYLRPETLFNPTKFDAYSNELGEAADPDSLPPIWEDPT
jgi:uncharacterized phage protein (TIGR02220 family)